MLRTVCTQAQVQGLKETRLTFRWNKEGEEYEDQRQRTGEDEDQGSVSSEEAWASPVI